MAHVVAHIMQFECGIGFVQPVRTVRLGCLGIRTARDESDRYGDSLQRSFSKATHRWRWGDGDDGLDAGIAKVIPMSIHRRAIFGRGFLQPLEFIHHIGELFRATRWLWQ